MSPKVGSDVPQGLMFLGGPERLDELLSLSDYLAITLSLSPETRGLIDACLLDQAVLQLTLVGSPPPRRVVGIAYRVQGSVGAAKLSGSSWHDPEVGTAAVRQLSPVPSKEMAPASRMGNWGLANLRPIEP